MVWLYSQRKSIYCRVSFYTPWVRVKRTSNDFEFNKCVQSKNNDDMEFAELNDFRKGLSLQWHLSTDKIVFKLLPTYEFAQLLKPTKRNVLKTGGMFHDLLRWLTPITIRCKMPFQDSPNENMQGTLFYQKI